jgi:hypothetical protein
MKKGAVFSKEHKINLSISKSGSNHPNFGKHLSKETRGKISSSLIGHPGASKGMHHSDEAKEKISQKNSNEKHGQWKGNEVSYRSLHEWIVNHKPKVDACARCGSNKPLEISNISGEYKRDIDDYEWLCRRCHMIEDGRILKRNS